MLMIDKVRELVNAKIKKYKSRLRAAEKRRESGAKHIDKIGKEKNVTFPCCEDVPKINVFDGERKRALRKSYGKSQPYMRARFKSVGRSSFSGTFLPQIPRKIKKLDGFLSGIAVPSVISRPPNLKAVNFTFAARVVIAVRDKFNGDAPAVYTAARITRQAYSQIVSDEMRPVSKRTAIRFAFALRFTKDEAVILLKSAGYAFSNSVTEDFIIQACLEVDPPIWDLDTVNMLLKEYQVDYQY